MKRNNCFAYSHTYCKALNKLYCKYGDCSFFKSEAQFKRDADACSKRHALLQNANKDKIRMAQHVKYNKFKLWD